MSAINVALLGFGTVGQGVYETIQSHQDQLGALLGKEVKVRAILIRDKQKERNVGSDVLVTDNFDELLEMSQLDIAMEAMVGREQCFSYLKQLIEKGCHVITANKQMFAYHGEELQQLASQNGVSIRFEATVAGGVPIIQTLQQLLNVNRIQRVQGILNGTSNYILSMMREEGVSFSEALKSAQEKGYAEADPTSDIEGYDAFYKSMILSNVIFGEQPVWHEVKRKGIAFVTAEQLKVAEQFGLRFKHVTELEHTTGKPACRVQPILVTKSHPFYHIEGVDNAITVYSDIVGDITLKGPGAGKLPTASAMIEDFVQLFQQREPIQKRTQSPVVPGADQKQESCRQHWFVFYPKDAGFHSGNQLELVMEMDTNAVIVNGSEQEMKQWSESVQGAAYYAVHGDISVLDGNAYPKKLQWQSNVVNG